MNQQPTSLEEATGKFIQLPCQHFINLEFIKSVKNVNMAHPCNVCQKYFVPHVVALYYLRLPIPDSGNIKETIIEDQYKKLKQLNVELIKRIKQLKAREIMLNGEIVQRAEEFKRVNEEHSRFCDEVIKENEKLIKKNNKLELECGRIATIMKKKEELENQLKRVKEELTKTNKTNERLHKKEFSTAQKIQALMEKIDNLKKISRKPQRKEQGTQTREQRQEQETQTEEEFDYREELQRLSTHYYNIQQAHACLYNQFCILYMDLSNKNRMLGIV